MSSVEHLCPSFRGEDILAEQTSDASGSVGFRQAVGDGEANV